MRPAPLKTDPVEALLEDIRLLDEDRFQLMLSLRRLILSVDPSITHMVKYGGLLFSAGSPFCGLFSYSRHVGLEFSRGADLADPHAVLEGDGKKRRHIKIHHRDEIFKKNVREYVERAFGAVSQAGKPVRQPRPR
jgi:hypothetical protein